MRELASAPFGDLRAVDRPHWALNTTVRCQHRCTYCFEGTRDGMRDVPAEETKAQLRAAAGTTERVVFMGSEPTLNPHLVELVAYAHGLGLEVLVSTNAIRLANRDYLRALRTAGLQDVELSFHYPDAATYVEITRGGPKGFDKLLRALDNIEAENVALDDPNRHMFVNVNVVVSGTNVHRLREVMAHVDSHLRTTRHLFTLKRLLCPTWLDPALRARLRVPFATYREAFSRLDSELGGDVEKLLFRGFPTCALPGLEHRNADLRYWLDETDVRCNFTRQEEVREMHEHSALFRPHRFEWQCAACATRGACVDRNIFAELDDTAALADTPVPFLSSPPVRVVELATRSKRGAGVLAGAPYASDAGEGAALAGLLVLAAAAAPGTCLPGARRPWRPAETGCILLGDTPKPLRLSIGWPHAAHGPFWPAGRLAVQLTDPSTPVLDADLVDIRALVGPLASAETPPSTDRTPHEVWLDACLGALAAAFPAGPEGPPRLTCTPLRDPDDASDAIGCTLDVEALPPDGDGSLRLRLDRRPDGTLTAHVTGGSLPSRHDAWLRSALEALAPQAAETSDTAGAARALIGPVRERLGSGTLALTFGDALVVRAPDARELVAVRLAPAGGPPIEGFLCDAWCLSVADDRRNRRTSVVLRAIGEACLAAQESGLLPVTEGEEAAFLREAWHVFGRALFPQEGAVARLVPVRLERDRIELRVEADGEALALFLVRDTGERSHAAARGIALSHAADVPASDVLAALGRLYADALLRLDLHDRPVSLGHEHLEAQPQR